MLAYAVVSYSLCVSLFRMYGFFYCQIIWFLKMRHCIPSNDDLNRNFGATERERNWEKIYNYARVQNLHVSLVPRHILFRFRFHCHDYVVIFYANFDFLSVCPVLILFHFFYSSDWAPNGLLRFNHVSVYMYSVCRCHEII